MRTNDATYTRPPKQQNHNYDALKHAEKATRHCFKAKCVSSELSNYCRVCFRCVNFKTNFKDSFSRALTQISCFFCVELEPTPRVDEPLPTNTPSDDNIIPLISSKTLIARKIHSGRRSFIYLHLTAAKAAAAKTVRWKHQKLWGKVTHTSLYLDSPSITTERPTQNKNRAAIWKTSRSRAIRYMAIVARDF